MLNLIKMEFLMIQNKLKNQERDKKNKKTKLFQKTKKKLNNIKKTKRFKVKIKKPNNLMKL